MAGQAQRGGVGLFSKYYDACTGKYRYISNILLPFVTQIEAICMRVAMFGAKYNLITHARLQ